MRRSAWIRRPDNPLSIVVTRRVEAVGAHVVLSGAR
jgi:hypothetical protein